MLFSAGIKCIKGSKSILQLEILIWAAIRENLLREFANNTGADQPAYPRSLISAFVIRFLESIIVNLLQMTFQFSS